MADKVPLFAQYGQGSADASIDGGLIKGLEGDSIGPDLANQILPTGAEAHQVLAYEGGGPRWTAIPEPDFQSAIDKLAPLNQVYEEIVTVPSGKAGKHQVLPYHLPTAGELTFVVESEPITVAQNESGYMYSFDPRAESLVSGKVVYTQFGLPQRDYNYLVYWRQANKVVGAVNDGSRVILYDVDLAKRADGFIGVITGLTAIQGLAALGDTLYVIEAGGQERLFRVDVAHKRFVLAGSTSSAAHAGLVAGTLCAHSNRLLAIANRTGTAAPILVELNRSTGGVTEIGGTLAFGSATDILAMAEHRGLLYYWLADGHTYRLTVDFSARTTAASSVGPPSDATVTYAWMADAPLGTDSTVADAVAFNHLTAVAEDDAVADANAWYEGSKEWFFGRTATGQLTAGAVTAGSDMRPLRVFERTFTGGRPARTKLLTAAQQFDHTQTPRHISLGAGGWQVGDVLEFHVVPWYHGPENSGNRATNPSIVGTHHSVLMTCDTAILGDNNVNEFNFWLNTRNISINPADLSLPDTGAMTVAAPLVVIGVRFETAHTNRITFLSSWTPQQSTGDVITVHQIFRLR